jgi:uncharacterized protein (DUF885 family)
MPKRSASTSASTAIRTAAFGHLQAQAFRAARLVVDTGCTPRLEPAAAIDYMIERTGQDAPYVVAEVDRYLSWPGQALGYMIGELKIIELARARQSAPRRALRHSQVPHGRARPGLGCR